VKVKPFTKLKKLGTQGKSAIAWRLICAELFCCRIATKAMAAKNSKSGLILYFLKKLKTLQGQLARKGLIADRPDLT